MNEIQVIAKDKALENYAIRLISALSDYQKIGILLLQEDDKTLRLECYYLPDLADFSVARFDVNLKMVMEGNTPIPLFATVVPIADIESMWWLFVSSIKDNITETAAKFQTSK